MLNYQDAWLEDVLRDIGAYLKRTGLKETEHAVWSAVEVLKNEQRWRRIAKQSSEPGTIRFAAYALKCRNKAVRHS